ncbi:MAG: hypothetical protein ACKPKO_15350, partial [Candidatus Fonsibacter sp.]
MATNAKFQEPGREHGFTQHFGKHRKLGCFKCLWAQGKKDWRQAATVHHILFPRTWMEVRPLNAKPWGLGRWVCRQSAIAIHGATEAQSLSALASCKVRHPRKSHIAKHQKSARHKRAVNMLLVHLGLPSGDAIPAPSLEHFAKLLN